MITRKGDILRVLLGSGSGRAGAVFFLVLVVISAYVVLSYPLDFGLRVWNNPEVWADNPKSAPPAWSSLLGSTRRVRHRVFQATQPTGQAIVSGTQTRRYSFVVDHRFDEAPAFTTFTVSQVVYHSRPPLLTLSLARPDGKQVLLYRSTVPAPRPGETPPVARYTETPLRVYLSGDGSALQATSDFLGREFGMKMPPQRLQGRMEEALFGLPGADGSQSFEVLQGSYQITLEALMYHPADSIAEVKLVLGGTVYGLMGTDALGRDLATGLLFGFPVALLIGMVTAVLATFIGTFLGIVSGYIGGKTDTAIQRSCDVLTNIPLLPILIFLVFILGHKLWLVVAILIAFGWPGLTIITRTMVLQIRSGQLVEATQALGASRWRIMRRHIFFQIAPFVLAQMIFFTPAAILAEAGLSFLGLGDPSIPTWGQILEHGFRTGAVYIGYWWWILPPGLLIVLTAMTFVLLTLGMEPVVNPRLRTR